MDFLEGILLIIAFLVGGLILAGFQRMYFPHTMVNGFMNLDKLKAICPELFKPQDDKKDID